MEPRTRVALERAAQSVATISDQIRAVTAALGDIERQHHETRQSLSLSARRARIQGLIEEYLRTVPEVADEQVEALLAERALLEAQIDELEEAVDSVAEQERLDAALSLISGDMTELARTLRLEHSEGQVRLRLTTTTLVIDTLDGRRSRFNRLAAQGRVSDTTSPRI
jgi:chromosome segregation ATPase